MTEKKTILIVGGGYADIPLIKAAKKLGYHTITSGNRPYELGHQYSDEYFAADFSDPEAILEIAEKKNIDAICPCANDFSAISSAYVAEKLGLPGHDPYEVCKIIHHKDSYRAFAERNGIPSPKAFGFQDSQSALKALNDFKFPVIVKPIDLTGGKGISIIDKISEAKDSIENALAISREKRIVVEEYITGSRHGYSAIIRDKKVAFHFADDEHYYLNPYMVSGATTPTTAPPHALDNLKQQAERISQLLDLKDGIFHIQYILHAEKPIIIEICRRPPGDLYIKLVEYATDVNYPEWIVKAFAGQDLSNLEHQEPKGYFLRHCIMADRDGALKDILFDSRLKKHIYNQQMWWKPESLVTNHLTEKFGIAFIEFDTQTQMLSMTKNMQNLIKVNVKS